MFDVIVGGFGSDFANVARQLAHPLHVLSFHVPRSPVKSLHRSNHGPYGVLESIGNRDERRGIIEIEVRVDIDEEMVVFVVEAHRVTSEYKRGTIHLVGIYDL
jgi:hypothetical protein